MSLGNGEYVVVSFCLNMPYDYKKIANFLIELQKDNCKFGETNILDINPKNVLYDVLWNGVYEEITIDKFSIENLKTNFLSNIEIIFSNDILARLQVYFLDEMSYEISLIFNYSKLIDDETDKNNRIANASFIEEIALIMFERIEPIYGQIGIEKSTPGLISILLGKECLPIDRAFYRKDLLEESVEFFAKLIAGNQIVKKISKAGLYFRNNLVDDFSTSMKSDEKFGFSDGIEVIKRLTHQSE